MPVEKGLLNESELKRLKSAIQSSEEALSPFRDDTMTVWETILGSHYGSKKHGKAPDPVNLMRLAVALYRSYLAANCPQFLVSTQPAWLKPMALTTELAVNKRARDMALENVIQKVVSDALICVGMLKIGREGLWSETLQASTGEVYAEAVHVSDLILDMAADDWKKMSFVGHRYRAPLETARNNPAFDEDVRKKLKPMKGMSHDEQGNRKPRTLSRSEALDMDEFEEKVELIELFMPRRHGRGIIITIPAEGEPELLQAEKWTGPDGGPYHALSFFEAPKAIVPDAPANHWRELHRLANDLFRKISRQAVNQKKITGYTGEAAEDAARLKKAQDMEMIRLEHLEGIKEFGTGGADPLTAVQFQNAMALFKQMAGNLDSLGGLAASAGTATAEQLLGANASRALQDMQADVYSWMARAGKSLCWWIWEDSLYDPKIYKRVKVENTDIEFMIPTSFAEQNRLGQFDDYDFSIQPYSMQYRSPAQELEVLAGIFAQYIIPFAGMLEQSGKTIDWTALLKLVARLSHFKELEALIIDRTGMMQMEQAPGKRRDSRAQANPNKPNGQYTRKNVSASSPETQAIEGIQAAASARGKGRMAS